MTKTTVNIHGKEYETVASRVQRFREEHGTEFSIQTEIINIDESVVVMKASIAKGFTLIATGHAEERRDASQINRTSALENCETSAIGRALAAFGMAGTEFASADEVANAIGQQNKPAVGTAKVVTDTPATPKQKQYIKTLLEDRGHDAETMVTFLEREYGIIPGSLLTKQDASDIIEDLQVPK